MGAVWLLAEAFVLAFFFGIVVGIVMAVLVIAAIVYAVINPIRSVGGWFLFLVLGSAMVLAPFGVYFLISQGKEPDSLWQYALLAANFCFLVVCVAALGPLYKFCQAMEPSGRASRFGAVVISLVILGSTVWTTIHYTPRLIEGDDYIEDVAIQGSQCSDLLSYFDKVSRRAVDSGTPLEPFNEVQDGLREVRQECLPAAPQAVCSVSPAPGGWVLFSGEGSTGSGITYGWKIQDSDETFTFFVGSDSRSNFFAKRGYDLPYERASASDSEVSWHYAVPGTYEATMEVIDMYGRWVDCSPMTFTTTS